MDNIQDKIAEIMADPQALSQVQSLGKMLGLGGEQSPPEPAPKPKPETNISGMLSPDMMGKIAGLMPLFQQINSEDNTTRLLTALRPFLSDEKCQKLDSAKKMLQFMKLMPLLKQSGFMDSGLF